ncbi:MAG: ATP-binding cassette domain-containing protein, partial [Propionibacteriaceae bacterium]|nr:ATP-binding cassette domain-containing protein [Propionibacteriaceae bacterium]
LGLYPCQQGQITLLGQPIEHFRSWRQIGYVPQRASVSLHSTTVSEVVGSGTLANRPLGWSGKARRSAITEALETVGLTAQASEPYLHLSGGQQQRVLIARGIVNRPRLVIMDEPFAGVDTANQTAIATALRELSATWLIVLHETTALADLLTRALVLREGRLVYDSPVVPTEPHPRVPKRATSPGLLTGMEPTWTS